MIKFDNFTGENTITHDQNWPHIPDHPHRILVNGVSGSRKTTCFLLLLCKSYFKVSKDVRINTKHYFIMKIPNKREFQQITINHS